MPTDLQLRRRWWTGGGAVAETPLLPGCPWRPWLRETPPANLRRFGAELRDGRGRVRVWLGRGHRHSDASGYAWRYRLVVAYALDRLLRPDEHVDHINGAVDDDRVPNLRLLGAEFHGAYHAWLFEIAGCRASDGRFVPLTPSAIEPGHRVGPIISSRRIDVETWRPISEQVEEERRAG